MIGKALYIDTEGSFKPERFVQISEAACEEFKAEPKRKHHVYHDAVELLDSLYIYRCTSPEQFECLMRFQLRKFVESHSDVCFNADYV